MRNMLNQTVTLFCNVENNDPFFEVDVIPYVLDRVRLSEGSKNVAQSTQGGSNVRQALLFFIPTFSQVDGQVGNPLDFAVGDRLCRGAVTTMPSDAYVITGINNCYSASSLNHVEVTCE